MAMVPMILSFKLKTTKEVKIFTEMCFYSDALSFSLNNIMDVETIKRGKMN